MDFLKNLWKNQPNTVMGFGALLILIGFFNALLIESRPPEVKNNTEKKSAPVKTYKLTAQEVVDKHEFKMRWACEDAIKAISGHFGKYVWTNSDKYLFI